LAWESESADKRGVLELFKLIKWMFLDLLRSRSSLEAEIVVLRQQLNVLRRSAPKRRTFNICDRLIFVLLYRIAPGILDALAIVQPETILRWHSAGFRAFWRWKSRRRRGRPKVPSEIRRLIRQMNLADTGICAFVLGAERCCNFMGTPDRVRCDVSGCLRRWVNRIS
jgi:hypothetical protein